MIRYYLVFLCFIGISISGCKKNDPEPEKIQSVSARINGVNYSIIKNKDISLVNGKLSISGDDWVNNHLEFNVEGINDIGNYDILQADFKFGDNLTNSFKTENDKGLLRITELSDQIVIGQFEMTLINSEGEAAEITEGFIEIEL